MLIVMDGAPGLVKAVKRVWPRAYRQRCQVHKMRNILAKLPRLMQASRCRAGSSRCFTERACHHVHAKLRRTIQAEYTLITDRLWGGHI